MKVKTCTFKYPIKHNIQAGNYLLIREKMPYDCEKIIGIVAQSDRLGLINTSNNFYLGELSIAFNNKKNEINIPIDYNYYIVRQIEFNTTRYYTNTKHIKYDLPIQQNSYIEGYYKEDITPEGTITEATAHYLVITLIYETNE